MSRPGIGISWLCCGFTFWRCWSLHTSQTILARQGERTHGGSCLATERGGDLRAVVVWHVFEENRNVVVPAVRLADFRRVALCLQLWTRLHPKLADAVPFGEHRQCHHHDRISVDQFAHHGLGSQCGGTWKR